MPLLIGACVRSLAQQWGSAPTNRSLTASGRRNEALEARTCRPGREACMRWRSITREICTRARPMVRCISCEKARRTRIELELCACRAVGRRSTRARGACARSRPGSETARMADAMPRMRRRGDTSRLASARMGPSVYRQGYRRTDHHSGPTCHAAAHS